METHGHGPASRTRRRCTLAVAGALALGLLAAPSAAGSADAAAPEPSLEQLVERVVELGAPGATLLVRDGSSTQTYTSGVADVTTGRLLRASDRYRVGSVTKTAIATLALDQVAAGRLALDAPVADYLPRLLPDGDQITVRHLLNHTSGLFDHVGDEDFFERLVAGEAFRPRELVAYSTRHDPLFPPGAEHSYSNTNYVVVGLLLRKVSDDSVRDQLAERILEPLGLEATSFPFLDKEIAGPHAHGYLRDPDGELLDATTDFSQTWAWTAGALISSTWDVAELYRALLSGELLEPAMLAEMQDTVPAGAGLEYGLGLLATEVPCGTAWGHNGVNFGYFTYALSTADGTRQAVVMTNVDLLNGNPPDGVETAVMQVLVSGLCADE